MERSGFPETQQHKFIENSEKLHNSLILAIFCKFLLLLGAKKFSGVFNNLLLDDQVFWGLELPENLTYYLYRENLIKAMITVFKTTTVQQTSAPRHGLTAALLILAVLAGTMPLS